MILFVFEGVKREPALFQYLKTIYRIEGEVICTYQSSLHSLYKEMREFDLDLVMLLREHLHKNNDHTLDKYDQSSQFSEVYLFFDYDFHDKKIELEQLNAEIREMLDFFKEETDNGKLYINYPMVESILYTKTLPDTQYSNYVISREDSHNFKNIASQFSDYHDYFFLSPFTQQDRENINAKHNWELLKRQNVQKANYVCNGENDLPTREQDISQSNIFISQLNKYVIPYNQVAILNSFPLFVYEYFK